MSILKTKITASQNKGSGDGAALKNVATWLAPLHISLCETIGALASCDVKANTIDVSPAPQNLQEDVLAANSLKLSLKNPQAIEGEHQLAGLALLSPALSQALSQSLLHVAEADAADAQYSPTKLDALLLQPFTETLAQKLSETLEREPVFTVHSSPDAAGMNVSRSDIEAMGELARITLSFTVELPSASPPQADAPSLYYIELFWPKAELAAKAQNTGQINANETPHLDITHPWTVHMRNSVKTAEVPLRAVVESCHMTIAECTRLEIGQIIALPGVSLGAVGLMIDLETDLDTQSPPIELARGALGIFKKNRALKLTENIDANFCENTDFLTL